MASSSVPLPAIGSVSTRAGVAPMLAAWADGFLAACLAWEKVIDAHLDELLKQQAAMGPPPQQMPERPEPGPITDTPWSHGN